MILSAEEHQRLRGMRIAAFDTVCDRIAGQAAERGLDDETFERLMRDVS